MRFRGIYLFIILIILYPLSVFGQENREKMHVPANEVYERMFSYIKNGEYGKIRKSLSYIELITDEINKKYGIQFNKRIELALNEKDKKTIEDEIRSVIYFDIKLNFNECLELLMLPEKAVVKVKIAAINYSYLSPFIKEQNPVSDENIKKLFRRAYKTLNPKSPYIENITIEKKEPEKIFNEIQDQLFEIMKLEKTFKKQ